jgi:hypothetical protein
VALAEGIDEGESSPLSGASVGHQMPGSLTFLRKD